MRILYNGSVGIGTTTPATKLHVVGDVTVDGNIVAKYKADAKYGPIKMGDARKHPQAETACAKRETALSYQLYVGTAQAFE